MHKIVSAAILSALTNQGGVISSQARARFFWGHVDTALPAYQPCL